MEPVLVAALKSARGDECPKCGASYDATELKNPRSKLTNASLVLKTDAIIGFCGWINLKSGLKVGLGLKTGSPMSSISSMTTSTICIHVPLRAICLGEFQCRFLKQLERCYMFGLMLPLAIFRLQKSGRSRLGSQIVGKIIGSIQIQTMFSSSAKTIFPSTPLFFRQW